MRDLAIYKSIVNCIHRLLKRTEIGLKLVPIELDETCRWK